MWIHKNSDSSLETKQFSFDCKTLWSTKTEKCLIWFEYISYWQLGCHLNEDGSIDRFCLRDIHIGSMDSISIYRTG